LLQVLEKRSKDASFLKMMQEFKENKISINTYEDLKQNVDEKQLERYIKDVFN
jgi:hypothetical protein